MSPDGLRRYLLRSPLAPDGRPKLYLPVHGIPAAGHEVVLFLHAGYLFAPDQPYPFMFCGCQIVLKCSARVVHTDELHELRKYAELRGVTCVGEMDVPGHSSAMISALPDMFGFSSAPTLGIVNFVNQTVIGRLQQLFDEIDEVLPSPFVAVGGDEVAFPSVENLPEVVDAVRRHSLNGASDLYRLFLVEMRSYAISKNKSLRVWVSVHMLNQEPMQPMRIYTIRRRL